MPKTREQKEQDLQAVTASLKDAPSALVSVFDKVTVSNDQGLRRELREANVSYRVIKKTLLAKAIAELKLEAVDVAEAKGNITLAIGQDEVAPAKVLHKFAKDNESYQVLGGWLAGTLMDQAKVKALASLPSKQGLIAKTVGAIKAPISGFVNVLGSTVRSLVNVLNAVKESKSN